MASSALKLKLVHNKLNFVLTPTQKETKLGDRQRHIEKNGLGLEVVAIVS